MNEPYRQHYRNCKELLEKHTLIKAQLFELASKTVDLRELADIAYAVRKSVDILEMITRQTKELGVISERIACLIHTHMMFEGPIRTAHCTASPDVRMIATIPKRSTEPEKYAQLMSFLGVPAELLAAGEDFEVVRAHWPGLVAHLSKLIAAGKPLPPGIDPNKTNPEYKLKIRAKRGVDEPDDAPIQSGSDVPI